MATRNRYAEIMANYAQAQPYSFFGYPQSYTGGYDVSQPQAYAVPVSRYEEIMAQGTRSGPGGRPVDYNPEWTALSDSEKAAFYARSPIFSGITQFGQKVFSAIPTPSNLMQQKLSPDFVVRQKLIAQGIDPDTGRYQGGDFLGNPLASGGFVQAPGEAGRGMPAPTGGFIAKTPQQAAAESAAAAQAAQAEQAAQAAAQAQAEANRVPVRESGGSTFPGGSGAGAFPGGSGAPPSGGGGGGRSGEGGSSNSNPGDPGRGGGGAHLAKGGYVSMQHLGGPDPEGPDDGYAALKDGEYVINDKAVKKYGIELMNAINSGKISKGKLRGLLEM